MELFFNHTCLKPISWILVETGKKMLMEEEIMRALKVLFSNLINIYFINHHLMVDKGTCMVDLLLRMYLRIN